MHKTRQTRKIAAERPGAEVTMSSFVEPRDELTLTKPRNPSMIIVNREILVSH